MSGPIDDNEICLFSLSLAQNLIHQVITSAAGDIEEVLDMNLPLELDIPANMIASDPIPCQESLSKELASPCLKDKQDSFEEITAVESTQFQRASSVQIEHNIEIKSSCLRKRDSEFSNEVKEAHMMRLAQSDPAGEPTLSQIFDRPGYSESSIFPFSLLGEAPEVLYQKYNREGYLYKKSSSVFLGWQKRYFQVKGFKIYYSKSIETLRERKELRCINLFVNPCKIIEVKGQTILIAIEGVKKKLNLKACSLPDARAWADFLQSLFNFINENQEKANRYVTMKRQKLLKLDVLTEEEFLDKVETGDVLLFQSCFFAAKLQRTFTSSKYDHVGLIVKAFDDVYLYDSVLDGGVQLTNWKDFKSLAYHKDYVRIAYRKLEINDPVLKAEIQENLFQFASAHTGRKYELSIKKLLKRTSVNPQSVQKNPKKSQGKENESIASQEGFFCSELVAAAYKSAGLLDPVIASSRYFPVSFSHKRALKLLRNANLSNEYGLAFTDT